MDKIQQILTELSLYAIERGYTKGGDLDRLTQTAITNAAKQIQQQERERAEKLRGYATHVKGCEIYCDDLGAKCTCGFAELEVTDA